MNRHQPLLWLANFLSWRDSFLSFILAHRPFQRGHLFEQLFKLHAGQAFQNRRQLADDLRLVAGFYAPLMAFLDHTRAEGFIRPQHYELVLVDADAEKLLARLKQFHRRPG